MTPTFSRIWFVNRHSVCVRFRLPASLRMAWLIIRACRPTVLSPICPSSSARGVSADDRLGARDRAGQLAQRLAHEARLQTDVAVTHVALDLGLRHERGDGVDADHVDGAGAHQHLGDLEPLLAVIGLGDQQRVDVHADLLGVQRVHRVLGVDERAHAAQLLRLGDHVVDQRRLTGRLRAEHLDDAAAGHAADAEREVERQRARRDRVDLDLGALVAHAHDGALAELALDLRKGAGTRGVAGLDGLLVGGGHSGKRPLSKRCA